MTKAVNSGATGFGELKSHVAAAGPELQRVYALAAELGVPVLVHFQEVPHTPTEGAFATGFKGFETILKAYPKTRFIGHADAFWADVSADCRNGSAYPTGKIKRGGSLAGKCVARETLTLLRNTLGPAAFRTVTWENAHRVYKLSGA